MDDTQFPLGGDTLVEVPYLGGSYEGESALIPARRLAAGERTALPPPAAQTSEEDDAVDIDETWECYTLALGTDGWSYLFDGPPGPELLRKLRAQLNPESGPPRRGLTGYNMPSTTPDE